MNLPNKLVEYRKSHSLSQEDLAAQLGVSRQSVSKWEQGLSFPETEKLIQLSDMMGISIDALLKGDVEPSQPLAEPQSFLRRNFLSIILACLLAATTFALCFVLQEGPENPPAPADPLGQTEETRPTPLPPAPSTAPSEPVESDPPETEPTEVNPFLVGLENQDLHHLQAWFFDFGRTWRLDYMPQFTREEGAPTDAGEYLFWAFAINLDHWGEDKGTMTREYVEETAMMYFSTEVSQHRSHLKQWEYDAQTECYTAYPGGIKEQLYYLLNSIEVHDTHNFTVYATAYYSPSYGFSQEEEDALKLALFEGSNTELIPVADLELSFVLDRTFGTPRFDAFTVNMLTNLVSW